MRVLVVHNRYRSGIPSGENRVVDLEVEALRTAGHEVTTHFRSSDELDELSAVQRLRLLPSPIVSRSSADEIRRLIAASGAEVLHLHNPYPLISMAVVGAARDLGVPVVQTVHNHRHTCMKGTYQRDGHDCRDCLTAGRPTPGVRHGCYRDSRAQSVVMAAALVHNRKAYTQISQFIALTDDIRDSLLASGFDAARITVKPNTVPDPGPRTPSGTGFVYVGRLSQEKGLPALIEAWEGLPEGSLGPLHIAGDGPARDLVDAFAARRSDVHMHGQVSPQQVHDLVVGAGAVVVPSQWPEAFPLVVLEAMAAGRALLVTDQGGLPTVVDQSVGHVVGKGSAELRDGLTLLGGHPSLDQLGQAARDRYMTQFHPDVVTQRLVAVYRAAALAATRP